MVAYFSSFYNPGNRRPLHRKRSFWTPYQKPFSTRDDSPVNSNETPDTVADSVTAEVEKVFASVEKSVEKFFINPSRFGSFLEKVAGQKKLSENKNFNGPDVIETEKQPININVDLGTVNLRDDDALRENDNDISRFIRCFHHAKSVIILKIPWYESCTGFSGIMSSE